MASTGTTINIPQIVRVSLFGALGSRFWLEWTPREAKFLLFVKLSHPFLINKIDFPSIPIRPSAQESRLLLSSPCRPSLPEQTAFRLLQQRWARELHGLANHPRPATWLVIYSSKPESHFVCGWRTHLRTWAFPPPSSS